ATDGVDADRHRDAPPGGDRHPAAALAFRPLEYDVGDDAIAQQDEDHRPERFGEEGMHGPGVYLCYPESVRVGRTARLLVRAPSLPPTHNTVDRMLTVRSVVPVARGTGVERRWRGSCTWGTCRFQPERRS